MEVNIYLLKSKINKKGKAPLRVHVGSYIKVPLKISVIEKNWNYKKQRVSSSEEFYFKINERIESCIKKINKYLAGNTTPKEEDIIHLVEEEEEKKIEENVIVKKTEPKETLIKFFDTFIERKAPIKSSGYIRNLKAVRDHLIEFNPKLDFQSIDHKFCDSFLSFLVEKGKENSTIEAYFKRLRLVLNEVVKSGYKINRSFEDFSFSSGKYKSIRLTWEEVSKIESMDNLSKELTLVRDSFIFKCNTGIRDSDYNNLTEYSFVKKGDKYFIKFNVKKTTQDQLLVLNSKALQIAEKYNFRLPKFTQQYNNRALKLIGKAADLNELVEKIRHSGKKRKVTIKEKWEFISTHTARRSFARRWYDLGGDIRIICHFLGHSTEAQTRTYIGLDDEDTNAEMIKVFDQGEIFK